MSVGITIGTRYSAHATSLGWARLAGSSEADWSAFLTSVDLRAMTPDVLVAPTALAAELAETLVRGLAIVDGEFEAGLRSAAVPVRGRDRRFVSAANVWTSATRASLERLRDHHLPLLQEADTAIEADLRLL